MYRVNCEVSKKSYIGVTNRSLSTRWSAHVSTAKSGRNTALAGAIRKYGEPAFSIEAIAYACDAREAAAIERGLIAQYGTLAPNGYNLTIGGEIGKLPALGVREKMSISAKKRGVHYLRTPEVRAKQSAARKAIMSDELRKIASQTHKGKIMSPETRAKISASKAGKKINYPKSRKSRGKFGGKMSVTWKEGVFRLTDEMAPEPYHRDRDWQEG